MAAIGVAPVSSRPWGAPTAGLAEDAELHAAVPGAAGVGFVALGRPRFAVALRRQARRVDTLADQERLHRFGAPLRQPLVLALLADRIGVAADLDAQLRAGL